MDDIQPIGGWCTGFFENWYQWNSWRRPIKKFPLWKLCKIHDKECSSHTFWDLLKENKVVFGFVIGWVASIACWVKYTKKMKKRI